jgi:hypothetical protein
VAEDVTDNPKVKGLSPATATGTSREQIVSNMIIMIVELSKDYLVIRIGYR